MSFLNHNYIFDFFSISVNNLPLQLPPLPPTLSNITYILIPLDLHILLKVLIQTYPIIPQKYQD